MDIARRLSRRINLLALAVTAAVGSAFLLGSWLFWHHHYENVTRAAQETAYRQADLIRLALEHQMQERERKLIGEMVRSFAQDPTIQEVRIVDREGETQFSGGTETDRGVVFEPSCSSCHWMKQPPPVVQTADGEVFRVNLPIENKAPCLRCHDERESVNGALIVDVRTRALAQAVNRDLGGPILVFGALSLALLAAIALSLRLLVLRRLEQFEAAARAIAAGQLDKRLPVDGGDTLSWMARAFNAMADSVMRMAAQLQEQRELLEMVINSVDDGIAVLDRRHRFLAANEAFLARAKGEGRKLPGAHCREVLGGACVCESGVCPAEGCFKTGERQQTVVTRPVEGGPARLEELHASPIRSASEVIAVVEVWRDITERRAAEGRMAQSHRMASLGTLASGFSHELNTPLATTLTCVESMLRVFKTLPVADPEEKELLVERANIAREQILRCRGITQQFLRLSRGQKASTDLVDLGPLAHSVVRLVDPMARERGVKVHCADMPAGETTVRANDAELQQVLLNLLLNAIQACAPGGEVSVTLLPGASPRLVVKDTGCGIPKAEVQKIFEPFYGLRPGGTGLGLFLSLSMARSWGAEVEVTGTGPTGSTFEVKFNLGSPTVAEA